MSIQAIETVYKGYRFRSRLEARWAVFFDALGLKWEYEKEGFDLGDAGRYLPDFWIQSWNSWVEIKPFEPTHDEFIKGLALASGSKRAVFFLIGSPFFGEHRVREIEPGGDSHLWDVFVQCRRCDAICLMTLHGVRSLCSHSPVCDRQDKWPDPCSLEGCYEAARSARFEHGESPNV